MKIDRRKMAKYHYRIVQSRMEEIEIRNLEHQRLMQGDYYSTDNRLKKSGLDVHSHSSICLHSFTVPSSPRQFSTSAVFWRDPYLNMNPGLNLPEKMSSSKSEAMLNLRHTTDAATSAFLRSQILLRNGHEELHTDKRIYEERGDYSSRQRHKWDVGQQYDGFEQPCYPVSRFAKCKDRLDEKQNEKAYRMEGRQRIRLEKSVKYEGLKKQKQNQSKSNRLDELIEKSKKFNCEFSSENNWNHRKHNNQERTERKEEKIENRPYGSKSQSASQNDQMVSKTSANMSRGVRLGESSFQVSVPVFEMPVVNGSIEKPVVVRKSWESQGSLKISDFQLGKCRGEGRFGQVFLSIHQSTGFLCAVKKIKKTMIRHMLDQFALEVKIQSSFNHPNIVNLYGIFADKDNLYMLMEYLADGCLFSYLKSEKTIQQTQTIKILTDIATGIKEIHDLDVAHRDLKPENIIRTNGVWKICDFGWAALCSERRTTYCGTLDYISPEIIQGGQYDAQSVDVWCLGVIAYELLVGKAPFYNISKEKTIKRIVSCDLNIPQTLSNKARSFITSILQRNPNERLSIKEVLAHPFLNRP